MTGTTVERFILIYAQNRELRVTTERRIPDIKQTEILFYARQNVKFKVQGRPLSVGKLLHTGIVREDSDYMSDPVFDQYGVLRELNFQKLNPSDLYGGSSTAYRRGNNHTDRR